MAQYQFLIRDWEICQSLAHEFRLRFAGAPVRPVRLRCRMKHHDMILEDDRTIDVRVLGAAISTETKALVICN